jgi:tight adherence protein C
MTSIVASFVFFTLVYCAAAAFWISRVARNRPVDQRFDDLAIKIRVAENKYEERGAGRQFLSWAMDKLPEPDPENPRTEKLMQQLTYAGFAGSSGLLRFNKVRLVAFTTSLLVGGSFGLFFGDGIKDVIEFLILGAALGSIVPAYYIKRRARIRQAAIETELAGALDLLVVCVESGLGLNEAIRIVGVESERQKQVIGRELAQVAGEISAGKSMGEALRSLAERTAVDDIKPLAATLIQSEQLGTQIGPTLRASADSMRNMRRLRAEERAQKVSVKMLFPLVLLVLPAMLALILGPAMIQIARTLNP